MIYLTKSSGWSYNNLRLKIIQGFFRSQWKPKLLQRIVRSYLPLLLTLLQFSWIVEGWKGWKLQPFTHSASSKLASLLIYSRCESVSGLLHLLSSLPYSLFPVPPDIQRSIPHLLLVFAQTSTFSIRPFWTIQMNFLLPLPALPTNFPILFRSMISIYHLVLSYIAYWFISLSLKVSSMKEGTFVTFFPQWCSPSYLKHYQAYGWCLINICWVNKWINE